MTRKVYKRESSNPRYPWLQFVVIADERTAVIEMRQALLAGWNYDRVTYQDWPDMTAERIIAWKEHNHPGDMQPVSAETAASVLAWLDKSSPSENKSSPQS